MGKSEIKKLNDWYNSAATVQSSNAIAAAAGQTPKHGKPFVCFREICKKYSIIYDNVTRTVTIRPAKPFFE